ncbi:rhodanese-like domain-containing protein [Oceanobacillus sp. CF4.6]|uniref:rhodanese-like domain-containing protein n=1 Tax=Oceanobacillus sp. CF4.6 TaxID=3373080 RepID=UPI003EE4CD9C
MFLLIPIRVTIYTLINGGHLNERNYCSRIRKKITNGENVNIIDVREDEEIATGKIPSARHIPLGQIPEKHPELNKEQHYYMVCRSGERSNNACAFLEEEGYDVTNMAGGMMSWEGETE